MLNILLTSAGRRSYLVKYFKEVLENDGEVHVANSSEFSTALNFADKQVITPIIYSNEYIPFLLNYCKNNQISTIIPLFDVDLPILSKNKKLFEDIGTKIIVSDLSVIEKCNDKWLTYKYLETNKIGTPKTFISIEDAKKSIEQKIIQYPVIIKPRWGMGSIGIYEANDDLELQVLYNIAKRKIQETYLQYESKNDIEKSIIIQEKIEGTEYGLDVINDLQGNYINVIVKEKYAMRSGETDCAITIDNPKLKELGKTLSENLKHIANLDVDILEKDNRYYVLEMNARFGGGYPFSHIAGANLPKAIISWLKNEQFDSAILESEIGICAQKNITLIKLEKRGYYE